MTSFSSYPASLDLMWSEFPRLEQKCMYFSKDCSAKEADMTKERIEKLLKAGANVVLTAKGIDDMALKYFVEAGAIAAKRVRKEDLHHVAMATGATVVSIFTDMEGEETFDLSLLGHSDEVVEERVADDDVIIIKGTKTTSAICSFSFYCIPINPPLLPSAPKTTRTKRKIWNAIKSSL